MLQHDIVTRSHIIFVEHLLDVIDPDARQLHHRLIQLHCELVTDAEDGGQRIDDVLLEHAAIHVDVVDQVLLDRPVHHSWWHKLIRAFFTAGMAGLLPRRVLQRTLDMSYVLRRRVRVCRSTSGSAMMAGRGGVAKMSKPKAELSAGASSWPAGVGPADRGKVGCPGE